MIDATILVPTYRHAALLPWALQSALVQDGVSIELFVVGDGVEDDTREAVAPFLTDSRVRFFDNPKGARHGEEHRDRALGEASGRIVCYLSDDDLLLPDHVAEMSQLLERADFAHSAPFFVTTEGELRYKPVDLEAPVYRQLMLAGWSPIGLTGAAHTMMAYRRLPHGWQPAPEGTWSDLFMWQQFLELPGFQGVTGTRVTALHLASQHRQEVSSSERVGELSDWWARSRVSGFRDALERAAGNAVRETALALEARVVREMLAAESRSGDAGLLRSLSRRLRSTAAPGRDR